VCVIIFDSKCVLSLFASTMKFFERSPKVYEYIYIYRIIYVFESTIFFHY